MSNNLISVAYSDAELRNLVEEYITRQKVTFAFKSVCSYVLYWAIEDCNVVNSDSSLIEGSDLHERDSVRIKRILDSIVRDGRIAVFGDDYHKC